MKGQKLHAGDTIEYLTIIRPTDQRMSGYIVWECRCVCGNTVLASSRQLKRKTVISCGCINGFRKRNQKLEGKKLGDMTVDYWTDKYDGSGKRLWHLTCECGNEVYMNTADINRMKKTHCGCKCTYNRVDLTGQRFGRLTAICQSNKRDKKGSVIWKCKCDCGNTAEASEDQLVHGRYVSCGCRKREIQQKLKYYPHFVDGTCIERLGNKPARRDNQSGVCGVHRTASDTYAADIGLKGKVYHLGTYPTIEEARAVREQAVEQLHEPVIRAYWEKMKKEGCDKHEKNI